MHPKIWLVRHGETAWSKTGQHTGRTDIPLTDEGRVVASRLASALQGEPFRHVFSSPLERAKETCQLAGLGGVVKLRDELMEWDYGDYEGKTSAEIKAKRPDWSLWRDGCPGGESPEDIVGRVDRFIAEVDALDGEIAVFAHGHLLRTLAVRWLRLPVDAGALLALSTATISKLGNERVLCLWNSDAHLME